MTRIATAVIAIVVLQTMGFDAYGDVFVADPAASPGQPGYYRELADQLRPGDTLRLPAGTYRDRLNLQGLKGTAQQWITVTGPESGPPAVITTTSTCCNVVQLGGNEYLQLKNLTVDSAGIAYIDGINSGGDVTHDILIENNTIIGQDAQQLTVGIASFSPAWNWTIRGNRIIEAGTGLYLGNSTGGEPFIAGVIEGNLVMNTIGYNMQIKHQNPYDGFPWVSQLPPEPHKTIVRHNVFIKEKNDWPASKVEGPRPNLLVGTFPDTGTGSNDLYEIYGNFFYRNPIESLLQATGRVSVHDNVFVNDLGYETAVYITDHNGPIKVAYVYNNTIYNVYRGVSFVNQPRNAYRVVGNMIFAETPLRNIAVSEDNVVDAFGAAGAYVNNPSAVLGSMDFLPRSDCTVCRGTALDLAAFAGQTDYDLDFNAMSKGDFTYRGAYAGAGANPGWQLAAEPKVFTPDRTPRAPHSLRIED